VTYHARIGFRRCGTSLPQLSSGPLGGMRLYQKGIFVRTLNNTFLALLALSSLTFAQPRFTKADFAIGKIAVDAKIESILPYLGKPIKIDSIEDDEVDGFTAYYFKDLIIWAETPTGKISSFDVSNPQFKTKRGLCVGDSVAKLERLYGKKESDTELDRAHNNFDVDFKDFTELKIYEYDQSEHNVFYAVFYIKASKVVKIYLYRGLGC